jgi:hypothetical protein
MNKNHPFDVEVVRGSNLILSVEELPGGLQYNCTATLSTVACSCDLSTASTASSGNCGSVSSGSCGSQCSSGGAK